MLGMARAFWDNGYTVVLFDFRSFAERPTAQSIGFFEQRDSRAILKEARSRYPDSKLGVVGASMGGAMALTTSFGEEGRKYGVGAVASDCAFSDLDGVVAHFLRQRLGFPSRIAELTMKVCRAFNKSWYGWSLEDVSPLEAVCDPDGPKPPLLLIHSADDGLVPLSHARKLFDQAQSDKKELWVVPSIEHLGAYFSANKYEYTRRLVAFFDGNL